MRWLETVPFQYTALAARPGRRWLDMAARLDDAGPMTSNLEQMGPFTSQHDLDKLSFQFFRLFSRAEYALKAGGFLANANGDAKADWTGFASHVHGAFIDAEAADQALAGAVAYMLTHPPKKQLAQNGQLVWQVIPPNSESRTDLILLYVRRVRNNLFHGGKFSHEWIDPERSKRLIEAALIILRTTVDECPAVVAAYQD